MRAFKKRDDFAIALPGYHQRFHAKVKAIL